MTIHRKEWKVVKRDLLGGISQNLVNAYVENGDLMIVTEPYTRGLGTGDMFVIDTDTFQVERTTATELNTSRRMEAGLNQLREEFNALIQTATNELNNFNEEDLKDPHKLLMRKEWMGRLIGLHEALEAIERVSGNR